MTDLPSLPVGTRLQETLLVTDVMSRTTDSGDPYTILTLSNSTGEISTAPFWLAQQDQVAGIRRGHVVQVIGDVVPYRDRRQLKVVSLRLLPEGAADVRSLLPSVGPVERYWEALDRRRREIRKPRLTRVVDLFYQDDEFRERYGECPASIHGHHAKLGGLLKHTVEVTAIARTIARACGADLDLVIAGALLHDIGKLESYSWHGAFEYTERGSLLGHVVLGALMLDRRLRAEPEPPCTDVERDILLHLVLAHHGRLEFGSPVPPMTLEAEVLHWADNASAKTASVAEALRDLREFVGGPVSGPIASLDRRRLYRGASDWGLGQPPSEPSPLGREFDPDERG
ncbi:MAG TPA: HD domain-containing protein [Gemmatimonadales bacterium]|nr:HD domain-containing protein [Gemmatimonadales bacterium]